MKNINNAMSGSALLAVCIVMVLNSISGPGSAGDEGEGGEVDCSMGQDHTMCKFKGPAAGCTPGKLTSDERDKIIEVHNRLRSKVASGKETRSSTGAPQPSAADMLRVEYDNQLAKVANRWAEQCTFEHDKNRKDKRFFAVGQNIAYRGNSNPSFEFPLEQLIVDWYDEVDKFDPAGVTSYVSSSGTGHYTQLVWHDTYAIGCGYASHFKNGMKNYQLVCNYAPAGNVLEQKMYTEGAPCSSCPSDRSKCSDSLCG